jgi:hypothetical protein
MLQRTIFLQVFLVVALSAIGQASAGKVVGSSDSEAGTKSILANKNRRLLGVKGRRQGGGKGKGKVS